MTGLPRRRLLAWLPLLGLFGPALGAQERPVHRVSAAQLQQAIDQRFPLRLPLNGLFGVTVRSPELRMLPQLDRIGAWLRIDASGPALARPASGEFEVDFRLRYERADRTLRAHRLRVRSLAIASLAPPYPELLQAFGAALAEEAFGEIVLHRLTDEELALPDAMGLEPETITVTAQGIAIGFAPRPAR
jgi:hypothetical protein